MRPGPPQLQRLRARAGAAAAKPKAATDTGASAASDWLGATSAARTQEGSTAMEGGEGKPLAANSRQQVRSELDVSEERQPRMLSDGTLSDCCQREAQRTQEPAEAASDLNSANCSKRQEASDRSSTQNSRNDSMTGHTPLVLQHIRDHPWMTRAIVGLATWLGGDVSMLSELERRKKDMTKPGLAPAFLTPRPQALGLAAPGAQQQDHQHQQKEQQQQFGAPEETKDESGNGQGCRCSPASAGEKRGQHRSLPPLQNGEMREEGSQLRRPSEALIREPLEESLLPGQISSKRIRYLQSQDHPTMASFWEAMAGLLLAADEEQIAQLRRERGVMEEEEDRQIVTVLAAPTDARTNWNTGAEETGTTKTLETVEGAAATPRDGPAVGQPTRAAERLREEGGARDLPDESTDSSSGCSCARCSKSVPPSSPSRKRYLYAVKSSNPGHVLADERQQRALQQRVAREHATMAGFWEAIAALFKGGNVDGVKELRRMRAV